MNKELFYPQLYSISLMIFYNVFLNYSSEKFEYDLNINKYTSNNFGFLLFFIIFQYFLQYYMHLKQSCYIYAIDAQSYAIYCRLSFNQLNYSQCKFYSIFNVYLAKLIFYYDMNFFILSFAYINYILEMSYVNILAFIYVDSTISPILVFFLFLFLLFSLFSIHYFNAFQFTVQLMPK